MNNNLPPLKVFLGWTPMKEYLSKLPDAIEMFYALFKAKPWLYCSLFWKKDNGESITITEEEWNFMTTHPFQFKRRRR